MNISKKIGLSVVEAGWLLQKTESQIRGMLHRGELTYVVEGRKIDPTAVGASLAGAYACLLLDLLLAGEFEVPKPEYRYGPPAPLYPGLPGFVYMTGFLVPEQAIENSMDELARSLGRDLLRPGAALEAIERSVR